MSEGYTGTPLLKQLTPYHAIEPSHQKYVSVARFHGTQKLNLMRPTRMPAGSRRYTHGDPVQLIDWRAYARNEQLVLREQNDEASCKVHVLVELAESMAWPLPDDEAARKADARTKMELAWRIALNLAYQFYRWGDQVKVFVVKDGQAAPFPLRSQVDSAIAFEKLLSRQFVVDPKDLAPRRPVRTFQEESADLVYWISDGFRGVPDWIPRKSLACWVQVLSSLEVDTKWLDPEACYFEKHKGSEEFMGSSLLAGDALHRAIGEWLKTAAEEWRKAYTHHTIFTDQTPLHQYMFALEQPWLQAHRGRG